MTTTASNIMTGSRDVSRLRPQVSLIFLHFYTNCTDWRIHHHFRSTQHHQRTATMATTNNNQYHYHHLHVATSAPMTALRSLYDHHHVTTTINNDDDDPLQGLEMQTRLESLLDISWVMLGCSRLVVCFFLPPYSYLTKFRYSKSRTNYSKSELQQVDTPDRDSCDAKK
jgi:hypothetical protein